MLDLLLTIVVIAFAAGFIIDYYHHTSFYPFPAIRQWLENSSSEFVSTLAQCTFCQTPHVCFWLCVIWFGSPYVLPVILSDLVRFLICVAAVSRLSWLVDKMLPENWRYERTI